MSSNLKFTRLEKAEMQPDLYSESSETARTGDHWDWRGRLKYRELSESNLRSCWILCPIPDPSKRLEAYPAGRLSGLEDARHMEDIGTTLEMGGSRGQVHSKCGDFNCLTPFGPENPGNVTFTC